MTYTIEQICQTSTQAWERASMRVSNQIIPEVRPFQQLLSAGYTEPCSKLFSPVEFEILERSLRPGGLEGEKATIYGAGAFGLHIALALSEAGAEVVIRSAQAPTSMARAIGILEPQGEAVEKFFHVSLPFFSELEKLNAPIRKDTVVYYYKNVDTEFVTELGRMPGSNYRLEQTTEFSCAHKLSFDGYIVSGSELRNFYMAQLRARGVSFVEGEVNEIRKAPDQLTFSALGLGRRAIVGARQIDLPGNRGQMISVEGSDVVQLLEEFSTLKDVGSIGIPTDTGSVNIVVQYSDPIKKLNPTLIIGATKQPGSSSFQPRENDYTFLMNGIKTLWPALHERLEQSTYDTVSQSAAEKLNWSTYVCVRPGGGQTPFTIDNVNGCIDLYCAGGTGNSIAPAAALKAISLSLMNK